MKAFIGLLLLAWFLSSCSPKIIQTTKTIEKDSVHVDSVKTTRIIKTKGDSVGMAFKLPAAKIVYSEKDIKPPEEELSFPAEDPIVFKKVQKQGRLTESVTISKKGNVIITCKEDSLKEIIESQRVTIQKFKDKTTTTTEAIQTQFIPKFYKFCLWWFIASVALIGVYAGLKLKGKIPFL